MGEETAFSSHDPEVCSKPFSAPDSNIPGLFGLAVYRAHTDLRGSKTSWRALSSARWPHSNVTTHLCLLAELQEDQGSIRFAPKSVFFFELDIVIT